MKLATYKDGSRDGQLVVVSRDLATAHFATGIADRLQQALDDWGFIAPQLQDLSETLNHGKARHAFPFDPRRCMAPLPRAAQWAEAFAWPHHLELLGHPPAVPGAPVVLPGAADACLGPCDEVVVPSQDWGIDFGAQLAVVTGDLPMGAAPEEALDGVRLLLLANATRLRAPVPGEPVAADGAALGRPPVAFGPVAVTPDELGEGWQDGRAQLVLQATCNGRKVGLCETGTDMAFHFGQLLAQLCRTRPLRAGSIVGTGPVSNRPETREGGRQAWPRGTGCLAEKRAIEALQDGQPTTGWLQWGDGVRLEARGRDGQSVFGAIDQAIGAPAGVLPAAG